MELAAIASKYCHDFLLAIVAVCCGIGKRAVNTRDLVAAYRHAFPNNAPLNKGKKALAK
ncbi:MAG: hypothetical protein MJZ42_03565 [Bacteroidales bacterium]|nr:hypothetical protein [Bacteroidales bacterium]